MHHDNVLNFCRNNGIIKNIQELAGRLGIEIKADAVDILMRFYHCTKRKPRFISIYTENDGSTHSGTGSLFDR